MKTMTTILLYFISVQTFFAQQTDIKVMDGFPPSRESQVTFGNYREHPFSQWSLRNTGAFMNVVMIPRSGKVYEFKEQPNNSIGATEAVNTEAITQSFETIFKESYADGAIILKNNTIVYEKYFNGLTRDYQHIWYSMTKSLTSSAFGILVQQKKIDLSASLVKYIPELKGSGFERITIQHLLNQTTAIDFRETYTDTASVFFKHYGPALRLFKLPDDKQPEPKDAGIYGVYDFAAKFIKPNNALQPGEVFEYQSVNVDVLGWIIARISGQSYTDFIRENIWAKIGAEHDAYIATDRAYMGVATGGMNSTLRDAALFGNLILNRGSINGQQIIPVQWVDETLVITEKDKACYKNNPVYPKANMPWIAYKNLWWILDETKGEYAAVGIHGQVIYINRAANAVIAYFSSQPAAGSSSPAGYKPFVSKLNACRAVAKKLMLKQQKIYH